MKDKKAMADSIRIWKRILGYVDGSKILYLIMFMGYTSIGVLGNYNVGTLLKKITNGVLANDSRLILNGVLLFIAISIGITALGWMVFHVYVSRTKMLAEYKIKMRLFRHLLDRPLPRTADAHSGDSMARLLNDSDSVANALSWDTLGILWPVSSLIYCGIITMVMNWKIGILTLSIGLFFLFVTSRVSIPMRKNNDLIKKSESKAMQRMLDFLSAAGSVRIMGIELPLIGKLEEATGEVKELTYKNIMLNAWYSTLGSAVGIASTVLILGMGVFLVSRGEMEIGNVLLIYQFSSSAVYGLVSIGRSLTKFQKTAAGAQRIFDILDSPTEDKREEKPGIESVIVKGAPVISVGGLSFRYRDELDYVLRDINLSVGEGMHVALVGGSGSGKSTFFKLLMGLYETEEGTIRIMGADQRDVSLKSLRDQFSYVSQDSPLFDGSIADNIRMGKIDSGKEEIKAAAVASGTHGFISGFPDEYDSEVGELGAKISGGQRQRIAITRAVMNDAPILLLDEATSSLDSHNETLVQEAIGKAAAGKTMVVAAHRLSTVRQADIILVFSEGRIIERGNHSDLMELGGYYYDLVMAQKLA